MARIKDTSVAEVKAAADIVDVVSARTSLRKRVEPIHRALPVPRGADAELLRRPGRQALLLLRLRQGRRRRPVRPGDGEPRLRRRRSSGSPTGSASRSSTRSRRRAQDAARRRRERLTALARPGGGVLRAGALGLRGRRARAGLPRRPSARRGDRARVPSRPLAGSRGSSRRRGSAASRSRRSARPGSRTSVATTTSRSA